MRPLPLFFPPSLPNITAAGFFRLFARVIEIGSEVDSLTTRNAASFTSSFLRFAMTHHCMELTVVQ